MLIEEYSASRHQAAAVKELLAMAMGRPTPEQLAKIMDDFYKYDDHAIFIAREGVEIIGMIGMDLTGMPRGFITHLAVAEKRRRRGVASEMIRHVAEKLKLRDIAAETDQDAVGFYRAGGFKVREVKSEWPDRQRFQCHKEVAGAAG